MIHNTLVSRYSGGNFVKLYHRDVSVAMTANLFAGTNHPRTISSAAASKIREAHNLVTTAAFFRIANDPAMPNFWPVSSLAARTLLPDVPDLGYLSDAPAPFALRRVTGPRRVGALQAPP